MSEQFSTPTDAQALIDKAKQPVIDKPGEGGRSAAEDHLQNAGVMYAMAGACFKELYQQQVLAQNGPQR